MSELTARLAAYGVEIPEVLERFVGDEEMYADCLALFATDKAFPELGYAIDAGDYKTAFEKAHSLKGVSANLGLQPLFEAVCSIVEPLRREETEGLKSLYDNVLAELDKVKTLLDGGEK